MEREREGEKRKVGRKEKEEKGLLINIWGCGGKKLQNGAFCKLFF